MDTKEIGITYQAAHFLIEDMGKKHYSTIKNQKIAI